MNPKWFGDSYDIVKRFFIEILSQSGYRVYFDPMFTGDWGGREQDFYNFMGAHPIRDLSEDDKRTALFLDPDTGIGKNTSDRHTTINEIVPKLSRHDIVLVFDQSFSRGKASNRQMLEKLRLLSSLGATGFYFDSHAKFLFASNDHDALTAVRTKLLDIGIPTSRLIQ